MEFLSKKITILENEIEELKDENEVLWFLLEQIDSRYSNKDDYKLLFNDIYKESRYQSLMRTKNESEA